MTRRGAVKWNKLISQHIAGLRLSGFNCKEISNDQHHYSLLSLSYFKQGFNGDVGNVRFCSQKEQTVITSS